MTLSTLAWCGFAEHMDGQPLGSGHLRIVVPGDKRGGRRMYDVVRITVTALPR